MGRMGLEAMMEQATTDQVLVWHLTSNHFPPLPVSLVGSVKRAITNADHGDWNKKVRMDGIMCRQHGRLCPTWHLVEIAHLDSFIEQEGEDY